MILVSEGLLCFVYISTRDVCLLFGCLFVYPSSFVYAGEYNRLHTLSHPVGTDVPHYLLLCKWLSNY